ncbi:hypothetical protein [Flagellimonas zhangzhouensis]|uniref:Lipoprotein n=1 Tax=Flagellimonas zhangzhouensis TaxID=1073328 RepID=A0A1H2V0V8_9FLAO|nr:hypothetical protein [Allomuricauda zhangzhouensis]SDQ11914.1 hypothetical protein SAMN05216294_0435 [Allomuricauda zhangzhouensis]SDW61933.1 hypothetical protein SAMN04487892_1856 [Allomuricauda zhangzhouensis]
MNVKSSLYLLLFSLSLMACREKSSNDLKNGAISNGKKECLTKEKKEAVVSEILYTDNIQRYLHLELAERLPIRLVKNGFISDLSTFNLSQGVKVEIVDSIPKKETNLILSIKLDSCEWKKGSFYFYSPIENSEVNGEIIYKDTSFTIKVIKDIEF